MGIAPPDIEPFDMEPPDIEPPDIEPPDMPDAAGLGELATGPGAAGWLCAPTPPQTPISEATATSGKIDFFNKLSSP
jgi:hypothetical protein